MQDTLRVEIRLKKHDIFLKKIITFDDTCLFNMIL